MLLKNRALLGFRFYNYLPSCKKLEKNYWAVTEENPELTDGWTDSDHFIGLSIYGGQKTILFQYLLISKRKNKMYTWSLKPFM